MVWGGGGVHIIIKKHFALLNICVVASYPNSGNLERRFFLGGGRGPLCTL